MRPSLLLHVLLILGFVGARPAAAQGPLIDGRTVVFVANGSGDFGGPAALTDNLRQAAHDAHAPLLVQRVPWCRWGVAWANHNDTEGQLAAAAQLADVVCRLRKQCPATPIVFVGHSSGTRVVIAAAEMLPPNSIDRIILLGSSVSCGYDLRPALRASSGGIDSFFSTDDGVLALAEDLLGTADGMHGPTGGRIGFRYPGDPAACAEYGNLRQYRWRPEVGGQGTHIYWVRPVFLARTLAPMLLAAPHAVVP
jgi:pimeloyl-ACP methyl ester carboxylesterase